MAISSNRVKPHRRFRFAALEQRGTDSLARGRIDENTPGSSRHPVRIQLCRVAMRARVAANSVWRRLHPRIRRSCLRFGDQIGASLIKCESTLNARAAPFDCRGV